MAISPEEVTAVYVNGECIVLAGAGTFTLEPFHLGELVEPGYKLVEASGRTLRGPLRAIQGLRVPS